MTPMETTLLVLIGYGGCRTLYDLSRLGLAPGSIAPSLRDLQARGLLKRESTIRRKRKFILTASGKRELEATWRETAGSILDSQTPAELDTVLRMAFVYLLMDGTGAAEYLQRAAEQRQAFSYQSSANFTLKASDRKDTVQLYSHIREFARKQRMRAEATALAQIADVLGKENLMSERGTITFKKST